MAVKQRDRVHLSSISSWKRSSFIFIPAVAPWVKNANKTTTTICDNRKYWDYTKEWGGPKGEATRRPPLPNTHPRKINNATPLCLLLQRRIADRANHCRGCVVESAGRTFLDGGWRHAACKNTICPVRRGLWRGIGDCVKSAKKTSSKAALWSRRRRRGGIRRAAVLCRAQHRRLGLDGGFCNTKKWLGGSDLETQLRTVFNLVLAQCGLRRQCHLTCFPLEYFNAFRLAEQPVR